MREIFGKTLLKLSQMDSRVYVLDADLANSTKASYVAENNPNKFIQCGIAEQGMVSTAAGMATVGLQPWVVTFGSFLVKRALDQIIVSVAQPKLNVKLIGCYTGILNGKLGKTHQCIEDIAIMRAIPNMKILCPGDEIELEEMMMWANKYDGPVYIRLTRESETFGADINKFNLSSSKIRHGRDLTIISTGTFTRYAMEASKRMLDEDGLHVSVIHMPCIKPLDAEAVIKASYETEAILTLEDHFVIGGLGSAVSEVLCEYSPCHMVRMGINDVNIESGADKDLLEKYGLSINHIIEKAKSCISKKK